MFSAHASGLKHFAVLLGSWTETLKFPDQSLGTLHLSLSTFLSGRVFTHAYILVCICLLKLLGPVSIGLVSTLLNLHFIELKLIFHIF